jgi:hypothetical protein
VADFVLRSKISSTRRVDFVLARKGKDFVSNLPCLSVSRALGKGSSSHHRKRYPAAPDDILAARGREKAPAPHWCQGFSLFASECLKLKPREQR